jgi:ACT domain-containing protein
MGKDIKEILDVDKFDEIADAVSQWAIKTSRYMEDREYRSAVQAYEDIQLYMGRRLLENTKNGF